MVASAISYSLIFAHLPFRHLPGGARRVRRRRRPFRLYQPRGADVLPENIIKSLEPELNRIFAVANRASPLTFGLLVTLVSITGAVEAIRDGLNRAYGCAEDRHFVRRYVSSLLFVFAAMAFLLFVAALGVALPIG